MAPGRGAATISPTMHPTARDVLQFWFGAPGSPGHGQRRAEWFRKDAAFDASIRQRFGGVVDAALGGTDFGATPHETLALILVLDQFTRNIHRGTPLAFAGDARACALAMEMTQRGDDASLTPIERSFVYLPFEHAEDRVMQDLSLRCFEALTATSPELHDLVDYAARHRDIILRFGRFPHRNAILGRASSVEELAFLAKPGSSF
jgi:uncharacterized protein (DUF924 family)